MNALQDSWRSFGVVSRCVVLLFSAPLLRGDEDLGAEPLLKAQQAARAKVFNEIQRDIRQNNIQSGTPAYDEKIKELKRRLAELKACQDAELAAAEKSRTGTAGNATVASRNAQTSVVAPSGPMASRTSTPARPAQETAIAATFPDERVAMAAYQADPSRANRERLADVRCKRALDLDAFASEKRDPETFRMALAYAESATRLIPGKAVYWYILGKLYAELKDDTFAGLMAADALQKAVKLDAHSSAARVLLGEVLFRQTRYDKALHEFETASDSTPQLIAPPMAIIMCNAYLWDYQWTRGERFFRHVLAKQADADCMRLALAILLHQQKKDAEAAQELGHVMQRPGVSPANKNYAAQLLQEWQIKKVSS